MRKKRDPKTLPMVSVKKRWVAFPGPKIVFDNNIKGVPGQFLVIRMWVDEEKLLRAPSGWTHLAVTMWPHKSSIVFARPFEERGESLEMPGVSMVEYVVVYQLNEIPKD